MREITQRPPLVRRMAQRIGGHEHWPKEVNLMQTLRASAIALPFVALAGLVAFLSAILG